MSKKEAVDKLLFICSLRSNIKVGDKVKLEDHHETNIEVLDINTDKALCKLDNGLEIWYNLHRVIRL